MPVFGLPSWRIFWNGQTDKPFDYFIPAVQCPGGRVVWPSLPSRPLKCAAYTKAPQYLESELQKELTLPVFEALVSTNNKLGQKKAAADLLEGGKENLKGKLKMMCKRWDKKPR